MFAVRGDIQYIRYKRTCNIYITSLTNAQGSEKVLSIKKYDRNLKFIPP